MVTLQTDRLTLRLLRETDLDAYAEMCADPEVMRHVGDGQPLSRPMAWRNLAMMVGHWSLRGYGLFGWRSGLRAPWSGVSASGTPRAGPGLNSAGCCVGPPGVGGMPPKGLGRLSSLPSPGWGSRR